MEWVIEELADKQKAPMDLLLNADPSEEKVLDYLDPNIDRGNHECQRKGGFPE